MSRTVNFLHNSWLRRLISINLVWLLTGNAASAFQDRDSGFFQVQSPHFVVKYLLETEKKEAASILNAAETYYRRVADSVGYGRYQNYWTWERRVEIILYPDQLAYAKFTGQPEWSRAVASRDSKLFHTKTIISYSGQPNFVDEILPHEISHLILWDYFSFSRKIPVWFDEGVAQLEEKDKRALVQPAMRGVIEAEKTIPFSTFQDLSTYDLPDTTAVSLFYAQSLSVVVYMIDKYGRDSFLRLNRNLREGKSFEQALKDSYAGIFGSLGELERKWKTSLRSGY